VAFLYNLARIALVSSNKTVKILQMLEGHCSGVNSVDFSHDSARLASASGNMTIKIWDASSGACLQTLEGHSGSVISVAFLHNSARLASTSGNITVIWDASSGVYLQTLEGHSSWVWSVAFSHNSARVALASEDFTLNIWDASNGACVQTLPIRTTLKKISSDATGSSLHTAIGTIDLQSAEGSSTMDVTEPECPLHVAIGLSPDKIWIKHSGDNMLWIPSEYRLHCSSISEMVISTGNGSRRVWFCRINS
jgi:WD40 repeat protein